MTKIILKLNYLKYEIILVDFQIIYKTYIDVCPLLLFYYFQKFVPVGVNFITNQGQNW